MSALIIIPAYNPPRQLIDLVKALEPHRIVMINDGSTASYNDIIEEAGRFQHVVLLRHEVNSGKGAALKTAFSYIIQNYPDCPYVVTVDADGQHLPADIIKVLRAGENITANPAPILLGSRVFGKGTPLRSLIGNRLTSLLFFLFTGKFLADTQTGLRAIPFIYLPKLLSISSNRYEFEMDMLLKVTRSKYPLETIPITTVYLDDNSSSHFNPVWDSLKIYFTLFRFALSSSAASLIDFVVFACLVPFNIPLVAKNLISRLVALPFYFALNRDFVFHSTEKNSFVFLKFLSVVVISGCISSAAQGYIQSHFSWSAVTTKIVVEATMFFLNFMVLKRFVFKASREQ